MEKSRKLSILVNIHPLLNVVYPSREIKVNFQKGNKFYNG